MKRILAIHDISTLGRTSLTMCIPVLSSFGMQVCPFVTSVLSATTAYEKFQIIDLTEQLQNFIEDWKSKDENFNIFYSGFLGSAEQQKSIKKILDTFNFEKIIIDPVFGDNGKLYSIFNTKIVEGFRELIQHAHIITPNITEFSMLSKQKIEELNTKDKIIKASKSLKTKATIVITSVSNKDLIGNILYDIKTNEYIEVFNAKINKNYSGTGDLFTSLLIGFLETQTIENAIQKTTAAVYKVIEASIRMNTHSKEGVLVEKFLHNTF